MEALPNINEDSSDPSTNPSRSPVTLHRPFNESALTASPTAPSPIIQGRRSSVSHVDVDFFDPAGVHGLKRAVTHISERSVKRTPESIDSDLTLGPSDGPFDLEKTLKFVRKK